MELQSFLLLITLTIAFVLLVFTILNFGFGQGSKPKRLPPGPWKLPIIGSLHHLIRSTLPHRALRDLSIKYGPLMHLQLGEVSTIIVSSPEIAQKVMRTHDINFADRPEIAVMKILAYDCTDISFAPYGDHWRHLRKICSSELLSATRVKSFQQIRTEEALNMIERIGSSAGSPTNLTKLLFSTSYSIISSIAFGKKCDIQDQKSFMEMIPEASSLAQGLDIADIFPSRTFLHSLVGTRPKVERLHKQSDRVLENIIKEHRHRKGFQESEDLIDVLLKFESREDDQNHYKLSTNNIKAVIFDVFSAGSETVAATLDWAMVEMMRNPRMMEKAQAEVRQVFGRQGMVQEDGLTELKYMKLIIKEVLRIHPPGPLLLPRECREKCEINGFEIPEKTRVLVNAWAIGRDPEYWKEPETFDPERFLDSSIDYKGNNMEYMPFGVGRRICPGIIFGIAVIEHLLAVLLYHFDWKLSVPAAKISKKKDDIIDMTESFGLTVRRKHDLYLIPTPYKLNS